MTANELRLGNWIYSPSHKANYKVIKLEFDAEINAEPITLTEEWFLRFDGFIKDGEYLSTGRLDCKYCFKYRDWADNWAFYIEYTDGRPTDDGVKYPVAFDIKYVHQLQNLYFTLTGEELTFKSE